jgi:tRNA(Ile)-lysidine synthase
VVRPLLGVSRVGIREYAESRGLEWREDRSNLDEHYARNRLRRRWLPALASDFNPQLLRTIGNLAEAHRRDAEWIETLVDDHAERLFAVDADGIDIARGEWETLPPALARRLARRALVLLGGSRDVSRTHLERFVSFLRQARSGTELELPDDLRLACRREGFRLRRDRVESETSC